MTSGLWERDPNFLIVDDDAINREVMRRYLRSLGYTNITMAENGKQALDILAQQSFDLVLLDISMPVLNGHQVLEIMKRQEQYRHIPVVMVSALDENERIASCIEVGAEDYITKPVDHTILRARVNACLERKRLRDQEEYNRQRLETAYKQLEEAYQELEMVKNQLELMNRRDGLTGIANRSYFEETLAREWRISARQGEMFSVVMFDIDFFKQYNDTYGHLAGDECLRRVAQTAAQNVHRPRDMVARFGGEEFAVVLPDTSVEGAINIAERLRQAILALRIPHANSQVALPEPIVTISLGVASVLAQPTASPSQVVAQADKALYLAKSQGRNCVKVVDS
jgi:diguanylate cyclase (GGDEF)-like protein